VSGIEQYHRPGHRRQDNIAIVGTYRRWRWLIDPEGQSFWVQMWSQYRLKKVIGRTGLLIYTYIVGGLFVVVAILGLVFIPGCRY